MSPIVYLILAIILEVIGTSFLKLTEGFTKLVPSIIVVVSYGLTFFFLSLTIKKLDLGLTYALWSALGTALIVVIGVIFFKEPINLLKVGSLVLIILGVVGLNLSGASH